MRDDKQERYPKYIPFSHIVKLKIQKFFRQTAVRRMEKTAKKKPPAGVMADGPADWTVKPDDHPANPVDHINKSAKWIDEDMARPDIQEINRQIEKLKSELDAKGLRYTNTAATFLSRMFYPRSEYTKSWENCWTIRHSDLKEGLRVMDIGGASTPFSFYLASRDCEVVIVDNDWGNCGTLYNAEYVAKKMGWNLKIANQDISQRLNYPDESFDRIYSICTIEHLTSPTRQNMMSEAGRILKKGGTAAITLCYDANHEVLTVDKGLRFGYREKFYNDVIGPSGLKIKGNQELIDYGDTEFLGAIFLEK